MHTILWCTCVKEWTLIFEQLIVFFTLFSVRNYSCQFFFAVGRDFSSKTKQFSLGQFRSCQWKVYVLCLLTKFLLHEIHLQFFLFLLFHRRYCFFLFHNPIIHFSFTFLTLHLSSCFLFYFFVDFYHFCSFLCFNFLHSIAFFCMLFFFQFLLFISHLCNSTFTFTFSRFFTRVPFSLFITTLKISLFF